MMGTEELVKLMGMCVAVEPETKVNMYWEQKGDNYMLEVAISGYLTPILDSTLLGDDRNITSALKVTGMV